MQTFLPFPDFAATARVLDPRRLGKQRVETLQIVRAITVPGRGWSNHPAVRMWRDHLEALGRYGLEIVDAWVELGYADTCADKIRTDLLAAGVVDPRPQQALAEAGELPPWLGDPGFHRSHQSALIRKDPDWYRPRLPDVPDDLPYVWPVPADVVP